MTPREVLASWSGWGSTKEGDTVADDIIDTLAKHGYRIVGEDQAVIDGEVVTLRHARNHKYPQEGAYIAGTFCGFVDDESDEYGRCADGFYRPLYVAEEVYRPLYVAEEASDDQATANWQADQEGT